MRQNAMQFLTIVLLCALGTWVYSGMDGAWRMLDLSAETYFQQGVLSDFWINLSGMTKAAWTASPIPRAWRMSRAALPGIWIAPPWGRMFP